MGAKIVTNKIVVILAVAGLVLGLSLSSLAQPRPEGGYSPGGVMTGAWMKMHDSSKPGIWAKVQNKLAGEQGIWAKVRSEKIKRKLARKKFMEDKVKEYLEKARVKKLEEKMAEKLKAQPKPQQVDEKPPPEGKPENLEEKPAGLIEKGLEKAKTVLKEVIGYEEVVGEEPPEGGFEAPGEKAGGPAEKPLEEFKQDVDTGAESPVDVPAGAPEEALVSEESAEVSAGYLTVVPAWVPTGRVSQGVSQVLVGARPSQGVSGVPATSGESPTPSRDTGRIPGTPELVRATEEPIGQEEEQPPARGDVADQPPPERPSERPPEGPRLDDPCERDEECAPGGMFCNERRQCDLLCYRPCGFRLKIIEAAGEYRIGVEKVVEDRDKCTLPPFATPLPAATDINSAIEGLCQRFCSLDPPHPDYTQCVEFAVMECVVEIKGFPRTDAGLEAYCRAQTSECAADCISKSTVTPEAAECAGDRDCSEGKVCVERRCVDAPRLGGPCATNDDCVSSWLVCRAGTCQSTCCNIHLEVAEEPPASGDWAVDVTEKDNPLRECKLDADRLPPEYDPSRPGFKSAQCDTLCEDANTDDCDELCMDSAEPDVCISRCSEANRVRGVCIGECKNHCLENSIKDGRRVDF